MSILPLCGINGQHLWGFLTAIGTLALLDEHARENRLDSPCLAFDADGTAKLLSSIPEKKLAAVLLANLKELKPYLVERLAGIKAPSDFNEEIFKAIALKSVTSKTIDLLAGLACVVNKEACGSSLCAMSGSGQQYFIQSMRDVLALVEEGHVRLTLFEQWKYEYRVPEDKRKQLKLGKRKPTLRLDPSDERLYALRLSNPTTTDDYSTEIGAQALAIPAFGLLPVVPSKRSVTVTSSPSPQRLTFSWPLWNIPVTLKSARSLIWEGVGRPKEQQSRGVFAAFSADRVSGDKGKLSFAPSQGLW